MGLQPEGKMKGLNTKAFESPYHLSRCYEASDALPLLQQRTGHLQGEQVDHIVPEIGDIRPKQRLKWNVSHLSERGLNKCLWTEISGSFPGLCASIKPSQPSPIPLVLPRLTTLLSPIQIRNVLSGKLTSSREETNIECHLGIPH